MSSNKMATKADLQEMYSRILPYLGGSADAGFTPVGTIISVMGVSAPANYLACNGQVVNIADYPELANYFYQQFGTKSKFGGDGTTTFGIPDLRGEFLRGTGTNAHTNQGNGAAVGTHQNGTIIPNMQSPSGGDYYLSGYTSTSAYPVPGEFDYVLRTAAGATNNKISVKLTKGTDSNQLAIKYTTRPTNTSVLYCIATKNIYMNPSLDYSTDEKVVGTYIDGKPIYQKTINEKITTYTDGGGRRMFFSTTKWTNIDKLVGGELPYSDSYDGIAWNSWINPTFAINAEYIPSLQRNCFVFKNSSTNEVDVRYQGAINTNIIQVIFNATLRYTKTTD